MNLQKNKRIRLKGKAKTDLERKVWERDNGKCVCCNGYVEFGTPAAHYPDKSHGGNDVIQDMFTMCIVGNGCHYDEHFSKDTKRREKIKQALKWYKDSRYCWARNTEMCNDCDNPRCESSPVYDRNWSM